MDILEKKNLLSLIFLLCCFVSISYADDNKFFNSQVDYFAEPKQECSFCKAQENMNNNVAAIITKVQTSAELGQGKAGAITLFIDPSCPYCDLAVKNLTTFIQVHPAFTVKVYVNCPVMIFLRIGQDMTQEHPNWSIINDPTGENAQNLGITKAPAYIFAYQGKLYRIFGTPDLEQTWEKMNVAAQ